MAIGNDNYTVLLIHSNNVNGSSLFADASQAGNSGNGHVANVVGDLVHTTDATIHNLGSSTITCTTSGYLSIPAHSDFHFTSVNFTIDLWFYAHSLDSVVGLVCQYIDTDNYFSLELNATILRLYTKSGGVNMLSHILFSQSLVINTWYHAAIVRNGNQIQLYLNGVLKDTATIISNPPQYTVPLFIGTRNGSSGSTFKGHLTEIRISRGVVRNDFPRQFPYTSANTISVTTAGTTATANYATIGSHVECLIGSSCVCKDSLVASKQLATLITSTVTANQELVNANASATIDTALLLTHSPIQHGRTEIINDIVVQVSKTYIPSVFLAEIKVLGGLYDFIVPPSNEFASVIKVIPTIISTLAFTARQNIVLKIRESLYGGLTIGDVNYQVTQVEGTTDFRGVLVEDQVASTPAVFVMRLRTQSSNNANLGYDVRQQVEDYFGILLVADNITDEYGVNSMDVIWAIHSKIIDSLLGWQLPETEFDRPTMPLAYRGGVAYGLELDSYHWLDQFSCTSQICSYRNRTQSATF